MERLLVAIGRAEAARDVQSFAEHVVDQRRGVFAAEGIESEQHVEDVVGCAGQWPRRVRRRVRVRAHLDFGVLDRDVALDEERFRPIAQAPGAEEAELLHDFELDAVHLGGVGVEDFARDVGVARRRLKVLDRVGDVFQEQG